VVYSAVSAGFGARTAIVSNKKKPRNIFEVEALPEVCFLPAMDPVERKTRLFGL
jgi:hypothetical protein